MLSGEDLVLSGVRRVGTLGPAIALSWRGSTRTSSLALSWSAWGSCTPSGKRNFAVRDPGSRTGSGGLGSGALPDG